MNVFFCGWRTIKYGCCRKFAKQILKHCKVLQAKNVISEIFSAKRKQQRPHYLISDGVPVLTQVAQVPRDYSFQTSSSFLMAVLVLHRITRQNSALKLLKNLRSITTMASNKIYELRTYDLKPDRFGKYCKGLKMVNSKTKKLLCELIDRSIHHC